MPTFVNNSGSWREVSQESIFNEGVWKTTTPAIRDNGVWKQPTTPGPAPGNNPLIDANLQDNSFLTGSPVATQIRSIYIDPAFFFFFFFFAAFEDTDQEGRGFINSTTSISGWVRDSSSPTSFPPSDFSLYFECNYRGFGVSASPGYGLRLNLFDPGEGESVNLGSQVEENPTSVSVIFEGDVPGFIEPITLTIPKFGASGWESGNQIYHLIRYDRGNQYQVDIEINGTTYSDTGRFFENFNLTRIQNLFPSTNAYKWFRFTAFDELITDTFYNDQVKGRRNNYTP